MRRRRTFVPIAPDWLEDRVALSHGMLSVNPSAVNPTPVMPIATTTPAKLIVLQGTVRGFATPNPTASPVPGDLLLKGNGTVAPLGQVNLVGPLSIRYGEPTFYNGKVTLSNTAGSILVQVSGIMGGPTGPPAHLHYTILSGLEAYLGATGSGYVIYAQGFPGMGPTPFLLTFGNPTPIVTA